MKLGNSKSNGGEELTFLLLPANMWAFLSLAGQLWAPENRLMLAISEYSILH